MSIVEKIQHYQRNIKKCSNDEDKMLHCISKLYNLPVTVQHLQDTGVGRTVNALRKYDGGVGDAAKALVAKWKAMVADEETSEGEDEDEACVPDAPESYSDNPESPSNKEKYKADNAMKISRHKSSSSKHRYDHSIIKSEERSMKHSSKHETKSKHGENSDSSKHDTKLKFNENSDSSKHLKTDSQKQKHEKNYNCKHELREEKHSNSKDIKNNFESSKKHADKSSHSNKISKIDDSEESNKKRKLDNANNEKKKSKKRKYSDCENEKQCIGITFSMSETEVDKKAESMVKQESILTIKDKNTSNKTESKHEKSKSHDKSKHNSNKQEHISNSKTKDTTDKDRYKKKSEESEKKKIKDHHHSSKEVKSKDYHSASSNKDYSSDKNKNKKRETENGKDKHYSKVGNSSKDSKSSSRESKEKVKIKQEINSDEGIDCNSGASFAEALGMCTITPLSKKRRANSPNLNSTKHTKSDSNADKRQAVVKNESLNNDTSNPCSLLAPNVKLEPLSVDLASTLPEISPNYKPLPYVNPLHRKEEDKDKALTDVIHVKNQRTKVYSGNKIGYTSVPTLYEMCIRVLIENIDALEFTGGVPYDIIKPVLERATPDQLFMLEHYNPYLIEDTDSLWQFHCNREFRNKQREEMETWREMYMRCLDEREAKLKTLTANIKQSLDKTLPMRSTKLAYVDNVVKPPRNVLRKQAKYGTGNSLPTSTSDLKKKLIVGTGSNSATNISVPTPPMIRFKAPPTGGKKTKAPLMAKALQLIKGRYKR